MEKLKQFGIPALLIGMILLIGYRAGSMVLDRYGDVRAHKMASNSHLISDALATLVALSDLERSVQDLKRVDQDIAQDTVDVNRFGEALYERAEVLRAYRETAHSAPLELSLVKILGVQSLAEKILAGDLAVQLPLSNALLDVIEAARMPLLEFVREQQEAQNLSSARQGKLVGSLTYAAVGLLGIFMAVLCGLVIVMGLQIKAQKKARLAAKNADFLAHYDPLTGLKNRTAFKTAAERLKEQSESSLLFVCNLDNFKAINETHGQAVGDDVLRKAGGFITAIAKQFGGEAARLGGDEFAIFLPGPISSMRTAAICDTLLADLRGPLTLGQRQISASMSIGVAYDTTAAGGDACNYTDLQRAADLALFRAKSEGAGTYIFFDEDMAEATARYNRLDAALGEAIANEKLTLVYQPQVDLKTQNVCGFEALVRWTHEGEFISPAEFIPIAEANGQILELDLQGFKTALVTLKSWLDAGHAPVKMSTNFAALHFKSPQIVERVQATLQETGVPPELVTLEMTESMLVEDMANTQLILTQLKELGVSLALDDFGTGYSSLANLQTLDLDYVKIDRSLVDGIDQSTRRRDLLGSLVSMTRVLDKRLVIEGVETEAQHEILETFEGGIGQGYLYSRPLAPDDALAFLDANQSQSAEPVAGAA